MFGQKSVSGDNMKDLIKREDVIEALNECEDIRGYAYKSFHDAIMEIPSERVDDETNSRSNGLK